MIKIVIVIWYLKKMKFLKYGITTIRLHFPSGNRDNILDMIAVEDQDSEITSLKLERIAMVL